MTITVLDKLATNTRPAWTAMITERRTTSDRAPETKWGRTGGTFHKGDEFFKK